MDKKTYEALKRVVGTTSYIFEDEKDTQIKRDIQQVQAWIEEVAKEYDE